MAAEADEPVLGGSRNDSGYGGGSYDDSQLEATWQRLQRSTGMSDPLALIHKALDQLASRRDLDALHAQLQGRLYELNDEAERLAARQTTVKAAAGTAARKRLERLHEAVRSAEHELMRATGRLELSDAAFGQARSSVQDLVSLASHAARLVGKPARLPDPTVCEGGELARIAQNATELIMDAVRSSGN